MINGRIRRYFTARSNLTVGNITAKDIEDFYEWMFDSGVVANTVIHYYTVLHSGFKRAFKDGSLTRTPLTASTARRKTSLRVKTIPWKN